MPWLPMYHVMNYLDKIMTHWWRRKKRDRFSMFLKNCHFFPLGAFFFFLQESGSLSKNIDKQTRMFVKECVFQTKSFYIISFFSQYSCLYCYKLPVDMDCLALWPSSELSCFTPCLINRNMKIKLQTKRIKISMVAEKGRNRLGQRKKR